MQHYGNVRKLPAITCQECGKDRGLGNGFNHFNRTLELWQCDDCKLVSRMEVLGA